MSLQKNPVSRVTLFQKSLIRCTYVRHSSLWDVSLMRNGSPLAIVLSFQNILLDMGSPISKLIDKLDPCLLHYGSGIQISEMNRVGIEFMHENEFMGLMSRLGISMPDDEFDSGFVELDGNGDILNVYGMYGIVPSNNKMVYPIEIPTPEKIRAYEILKNLNWVFDEISYPDEELPIKTWYSFIDMSDIKDPIFCDECECEASFETIISDWGFGCSYTQYDTTFIIYKIPDDD